MVPGSVETPLPDILSVPVLQALRAHETQGVCLVTVRVRLTRLLRPQQPPREGLDVFQQRSVSSLSSRESEPFLRRLRVSLFALGTGDDSFRKLTDSRVHTGVELQWFVTGVYSLVTSVHRVRAGGVNSTVFRVRRASVCHRRRSKDVKSFLRLRGSPFSRSHEGVREGWSLDLYGLSLPTGMIRWTDVFVGDGERRRLFTPSSALALRPDRIRNVLQSSPLRGRCPVHESVTTVTVETTSSHLTHPTVKPNP